MSNANLETQWMIWYPNEVCLKHIKNNKTTLFCFDKLKKEDFCTKIENNNAKKIKKELEIEKIKIQTYDDAFKKGVLAGQSNHDMLKQKFNNLFLSFEREFSNFENKLYSEILKTVLKISAYVIGKSVDINQSVLLNCIKKIIDEHSSILQRPKITIHPDNKTLVEKEFKNFFKSNQWILEYDHSIDVNGCKVTSDNSFLDATVDSRWQELCRLMLAKEY